MRLRRDHIGCWARVRWDDIGATDCLIIELDDDRQGFRGFFPACPENNNRTIDASQVASIGPRAEVPAF